MSRDTSSFTGKNLQDVIYAVDPARFDKHAGLSSDGRTFGNHSDGIISLLNEWRPQQTSGDNPATDRGEEIAYETKLLMEKLHGYKGPDKNAAALASLALTTVVNSVSPNQPKLTGQEATWTMSSILAFGLETLMQLQHVPPDAGQSSISGTVVGSPEDMDTVSPDLQSTSAQQVLKGFLRRSSTLGSEQADGYDQHDYMPSIAKIYAIYSKLPTLTSSKTEEQLVSMTRETIDFVWSFRDPNSDEDEHPDSIATVLNTWIERHVENSKAVGGLI